MKATLEALFLAALAALAGACATEAPPAQAPPPTTAPAPAPKDAETPLPEPAVEQTRRIEEAMEQAPRLAPAAVPSDGVVELLFEPGAAALTEAARTHLDGLGEWLMAEAAEFYLDLHGHSDSTGDELANRILAEQRAEVVRSYLHRQHGVPLDRMGVVSLGDDAPAGDNRTADGRERNRRVVVVVVAPPSF